MSLTKQKNLEINSAIKIFIIMIMGAESGGLFVFYDERSVIKYFSWDQSAADVHGYFAAVGVTSDGEIMMLANPRYWFERADESERKRTFFHELEHVVSERIGYYVKDWHTDETELG